MNPTSSPRRASGVRPATATSRPPGPGRSHPPVSPRWRPPPRSPAPSPPRRPAGRQPEGACLIWNPSPWSAVPPSPGPVRRGHRPDHPQRLAQAGRAHRLRRRPVPEWRDDRDFVMNQPQYAGASISWPAPTSAPARPGARGLGDHGLRLPGRDLAPVRRHLPQQLHQERPRAGAGGRGGRSPALLEGVQADPTLEITVDVDRRTVSAPHSASRRRSARRRHPRSASCRPRRHRHHPCARRRPSTTTRPAARATPRRNTGPSSVGRLRRSGSHSAARPLRHVALPDLLQILVRNPDTGFLPRNPRAGRRTGGARGRPCSLKGVDADVVVVGRGSPGSSQRAGSRPPAARWSWSRPGTAPAGDAERPGRRGHRRGGRPVGRPRPGPHQRPDRRARSRHPPHLRRRRRRVRAGRHPQGLRLREPAAQPARPRRVAASPAPGRQGRRDAIPRRPWNAPNADRLDEQTFASWIRRTVKTHDARAFA